MKYLLKLIAAIAQEKKDEEILAIARDRQLEIEEEVTKLSSNDVNEIIDVLFPEGISTDNNFYKLLEDIEHCAGFKTFPKGLIAQIWINAYNRLIPDDQINLLQSLLDENARGFWTAIQALPEFLSQVEIKFQFAAEWFFELVDRTKNDLLGGDVFEAVKKYAIHFPESGLRVFEKYVSESLDEMRLSLAATLLGTVRSRAHKGYIAKDSIKNWDDQFQNSPKTAFRLCYYRSLIASFDLDALSIAELDVNLSKMLNGDQEEISEAFNTVYRCLLGKLSDNGFVTYAVKWFSKNASGQIPDLAKYCVVEAMWRLCRTRKGDPRLINLSEANNLLVAIQPIPINNLGTWHQLEYYLVDRLREGEAIFEDIFAKLVEANAEGLLAQFEKKFSYLKSKLPKYSNIKTLVTQFLISPEQPKRRTGNLLFGKISLNSFSEEVLNKADESQLKIMLLEFIRQPFLGEKTAQFLLFIEPRFRRASSELQEMFRDEMVMQAINYPGACLDKWKKISNPSNLLQKAIKTAEEYFENLKKIKDSPAISFSFSGHEKAVETERYEFSNQITKKAHEESVIAKLAKNVQIIYGSRSSVMREGKIGEDTPFSEFSSSIEFPRLEAIDPEGMIIRRLQASSRIKDLEKNNVSS